MFNTTVASKNILMLQALPEIKKSVINSEYASLLDNTQELLEKIAQNFPNISPELLQSAQIKAAEQLENLDKKNISVLTLNDNRYPKWFKDLKTKPALLYAKGNLDLLSQDGIAVIGTRHPSSATKANGSQVILNLVEKVAEKLGKPSDKIPIISGLALGCDGIAHKIALENSIPTIAVLPSGFNAIAPKSHVRLAQEIIENGGCLVSEYLPSAEVKNYTYVERDRLTAAFVPGILVLECGVPSGTLHTVRAGVSRELERILGVCSSAYAGNKLILEKMGGYDITTPEGLNNYVTCLINKVSCSSHKKKTQPTLSDFEN